MSMVLGMVNHCSSSFFFKQRECYFPVVLGVLSWDFPVALDVLSWDFPFVLGTLSWDFLVCAVFYPRIFLLC